MTTTVTANADRRLGHAAVEAAIRALGNVKLSPRGDSMLRVLLAFSAIRKDKSPTSDTTQGDVERVVADFFRVVDGPKEFPGTLRLRGSGGAPGWLVNGSFLGSWIDYGGPNNAGRHLFDGDDWHKPLRGDAVTQVAAAKGRADNWPPRDAVAAIALRERELDPTLTWAQLIDMARTEFGLSATDFATITSDPVLADVAPFDGSEWDPAQLANELRPASASTVEQSELTLESLPETVEAEVKRVIDALRRYGSSKIIALAGVPGTSKTYVAKIAARAYASPGCLREIQFSPGYTYEEFMEGPRLEAGKLEPFDGILRDFNQKALDHPEQQFVLLIEEFSRADIPKVLGELLTYIEYRSPDDEFTTLYRRDARTRIAPNLAVLATYNPTDRSAVTIDAAILRRLRVLSFPPNTALLREMLTRNGVDVAVVDKLVEMFDACRDATSPERFDEAMPFGHAVFNDVQDEEDLYDLWSQELRPILIRPRTPQHELYDTIRDGYPWAVDPAFRLPTAAPATPAAEGDDDGTGSTEPDTEGTAEVS